MQSISVHLDITKVAEGVCHVIYKVGYDYVKFHHCRICEADFREGAPPFDPWAAPKRPILNRVINYWKRNLTATIKCKTRYFII